MFTGLVEETGTIRKIQEAKDSIVLEVDGVKAARKTRAGDSVAVNGCCLTVVRITRRSRTATLQFQLLRETWERAGFSLLGKGSLVNLERSLRADSLLGGHFVTGHIDGQGTIKRWEKEGRDYALDIQAPASIMRYVIHKGSIAVDGISLTVAEAKARQFRIWIIPHTYQVTNLKQKKKGDRVNLEPDLLGKYVERFLQLRS